MTPVGPDAGREQANHIFIAGGRCAGNPWRFQWPILGGVSRHQPHGSSIEPMTGIKLSRVRAGRVAHATHRHPIHDVLPARNPVFVSSGLPSRARLTRCLWPPADDEHSQTQNDHSP